MSLVETSITYAYNRTHSFSHRHIWQKHFEAPQPESTVQGQFGTLQNVAEYTIIYGKTNGLHKRHSPAILRQSDDTQEMWEEFWWGIYGYAPHV